MNAPKVGDPATIHVGSDSYGATVIQVSDSGKTVWVQRNRALRNGMHLIDRKGQVDTCRLRADGSYRLPGHRGSRVTFGERISHWDPHF